MDRSSLFSPLALLSSLLMPVGMMSRTLHVTSSSNVTRRPASLVVQIYISSYSKVMIYKSLRSFDTLLSSRHCTHWQCLSSRQQSACWGLIPTISWLPYFSASCYSDNWRKVGTVIRMVFHYHQAPKVIHWSVTFSICQSTNLGSFMMNGVRPTVGLS